VKRVTGSAYGNKGKMMARFTKENTEGADDEDIAQMNERYYLVADAVKPETVSATFFDNLAEIIRHEVMVGKRLKEAFRAYQQKGGGSGE
jgi:hypothetical protein